MKPVLKICLATALLTCTVYAGEPHVTKQLIRGWVPGHDTTGIGWYHYNLRTMQTNPLNYLTRTSVGSIVQYSASTNTAAWNVEEGNMVDAWLGGDTCITIGGWDIAYDNDPSGYGNDPSHMGYYFLFSDTLVATVATQTWKADDTLRVMIAPVASQIGGLVDVQIQNPRETDHVPWGASPYDVVGYWLVSDTTGAGTPNSMDVVIGYFPVMGGQDDLTLCTYNPAVVWGHGGTYEVRHAYYIITRGTNPGYMFRTPYMSQNSNIYVIVGTEEDEKTPTSCAVFAAPVFRHSTAIRYTLPNQTHVILKIYNASGQLVQTLVDGVKLAGEHTVSFDASTLSSGIYFYHFETTEETISGKIVVLQ